MSTMWFSTTTYIVEEPNIEESDYEETLVKRVNSESEL